MDNTPTGTPTSEDATCAATSVLEDVSLEVKAYVQPLGVENAWTDLGEGTVEITGNTIRVRSFPTTVTADDCDGDSDAAEQLQTALDAQGEEPLLEDELDSETQLVGRDSCIVWNSPSQELSFCLMFATDMGYDAVHAAFQYIVSQDMSTWTVDLFQELREAAPSSAAFSESLARELDTATSLGFIERHVIVASFIAGDYAATPAVIANSDICHSLLSLHHPAVIEYLLDDARFALFVKANSAEGEVPPAMTAWQPPASLQGLPLVDDVSATITRVMRLHALHPSKGPAEANAVLEALEAVTQRQLGALLVQLTASDEFLQALGEGLVNSCEFGPDFDPAAAEAHLRCLSDLLELTAKIHGRDSVTPAVTRIFEESNALVALAAAAKALRQKPHPRMHAAFCRVLDASLVVLNQKGDEVAMAQVFRDPIVQSAKAGTGRQDALAPFMSYLVSACAPPPQKLPNAVAAGGSAATALSASPPSARSGSVGSTTSSESVLTLATTASGPASPSPASNPAAFVSLAAYLPAKSANQPPSVASKPPTLGQTSAASSEYSGHGPQYLFHLLGLHDDEGTTVDRAPTAESVESRAAIQRHFVASHVYALLQNCNAANVLPESVSNVLEYVLRLTPAGNRDRLAQYVLSSRSPLPALMMLHNGGRNKAEFCATLRLVRGLLLALLGLERKETLMLAHRLTFANDIFGVFTARLAADRRRSSMSHCVFNSVIELLSVQNATCPSADQLEPIRKYIMLKYRAALPPSFVKNVEAAELAALAQEMSHDGAPSPVPFVSPSRACSPAPGVDLSSQRRRRVAEEELPPDHRHNELSSRMRALANRNASKSASASPTPADEAAEPERADPAPVDVAEAAASSAGVSAAAAAADASSATTTNPSSSTTAAAADDGNAAAGSATTSKPRRPVAPLTQRKAGGPRRVPLKTKPQMIGS